MTWMIWGYPRVRKPPLVAFWQNQHGSHHSSPYLFTSSGAHGSHLQLNFSSQFNTSEALKTPLSHLTSWFIAFPIWVISYSTPLKLGRVSPFMLTHQPGHDFASPRRCLWCCHQRSSTAEGPADWAPHMTYLSHIGVSINDHKWGVPP